MKLFLEFLGLESEKMEVSGWGVWYESFGEFLIQ